jgi:hypothetical protein
MEHHCSISLRSIPEYRMTHGKKFSNGHYIINHVNVINYSKQMIWKEGKDNGTHPHHKDKDSLDVSETRSRFL